MKERKDLWILLVGCAGVLFMLSMLCIPACLFLRYPFPYFKAEGQAMVPALHSGDLFWVSPWAYRQRLPDRGDIIVFSVYDRAGSLFKRVIGLPGEQVMILDGKVFIDGELLAEPYATGPTASGRENAWELRAGEVFVLGDNRAYSNDSRSFGPVTIDRIVGKVFFVLTPDSMQLVPTVSYPTPATTP